LVPEIVPGKSTVVPFTVRVAVPNVTVPPARPVRPPTVLLKPFKSSTAPLASEKLEEEENALALRP
jgi:hypothetical protein